MDVLKKIEAGSFTGLANQKQLSKEDMKTQDAAKQFESLLLHQMLNAMSANLGKDELLGGSREQEFARDLYNQALAESIAEGKGIGIKEVLARENMKKNNKLPEAG